jgi:CO/xanthine dehydrogenase Mo-binding subunit
MPLIRTDSIESPSPFAPLGAKGMGEGGGGAVHAICSAIQDALSRSGSRAVVTDSHNPPSRIWQLLQETGDATRPVVVVSTAGAGEVR